MLPDQLADKINFYYKRYPEATLVIDPAQKQTVEAMRARYNLPLITAEKLGKRTHIEFLNNALHQGVFFFKRLSEEETSAYDQMSVLEWDKRHMRESEDFPADLADATLYAFTYVYNYHNQSTLKEVPTAEEELRAYEERTLRQAMRDCVKKPGDMFRRRFTLRFLEGKRDKMTTTELKDLITFLKDKNISQIKYRRIGSYFLSNSGRHLKAGFIGR